MPRPTRQSGFTLIELMTVVVVLAVIAVIGAPGLQTFLAGQRAKALTFDLTADLLLARNEALKRGLDVTLEPSGGNWQQGWVMRVGDTELGRRNALGDTVALADAPDAIVFNRSGRVAVPNSSVRMTVRVAGESSAQASRCVQLDLSGRARAASGGCT